MPDDVVIKVENLSKLYRLGELHKQTNSFREKVTKALSRIAHSAKRKASNPVPQDAMRSAPCSLRSSQSDDHLWALRNVSFEVKRGEVLGIIGRNGAGKSTLLKILSRITKPTEGTAWINGRVASLLEVGTGFHQELTGRENIFLNGAILGMTKAEIRRKFDEIVEFSGIEKFIDTPVKRYSSGMYVRLAFSVAAHLDPEILLVDEVLAVGDLEFQRKCLGRMREITKRGRTVLFVSHNLAAIGRLCDKVLLIEEGKRKYLDKTNEVLSLYQAGKLIPNQHSHKPIIPIFEQPDISDGVLVTGVKILDSKLLEKESVMTLDKIQFRISFSSKFSSELIGIDIGVESPSGERIFMLASHTQTKNDFTMNKGQNTIFCSIETLPLAAGDYLLTIGISKPKSHYYYLNRQYAWIRVLPKDVYDTGYPPVQITTNIALRVKWKSDMLET